MTRPFRYSCRTALCILLILNLHVWGGGCGVGGAVSADGRILIPLSPNDPLAQTLAGSSFQNVTGLEIDPGQGRFRLVFAEPDRRVSGSFVLVGGEPVVTRLDLGMGSLSMDLLFDEDMHVIGMVTSSGRFWARPTDWGDGAAGETPGFATANAQLLDLARALDADALHGTPSSSLGGGQVSVSPSGSGDEAVGKTKRAAAQDATGGLGDVLGTLGLIVGLPVALLNAPALLFVLQAVIGLQLTMGLTGGGSLDGLIPDLFGGPASAVQPTTGAGGGETATLRVTNELTGGVPIWFVTLSKDRATGAAGGNILGDESIAAGASRDFPLPAGVRDVSIIVPSGVDCFLLIQHRSVSLLAGAGTELVVQDSDEGEIIPEGCDNG